MKDRTRLERLSPWDVSNLLVESRGLPMNVAAIAFLEADPLIDASGGFALEAARTRIAGRLDLAPRLRQKLHTPGFGFGPPVWVDDEAFDVSRHVRTRAVPVPGDEHALLATCVELSERPFDRAFPLWEIWFLTGLAEGTVAMLIRFHHVLADGIAALALLGALFDAEAETREDTASTWIPKPPPTQFNLLIDNLSRYIASMHTGWDRIRHPRPTLRRLGILARQSVRLMREGRAPALSFNRPGGKHQRLMFVRADLERARKVAHEHHATVNDVVLTAIAGGARALLDARRELRPKLTLKVSVAASVRTPSDAVRVGNFVGIMIVPVPVHEADPIRRLERIAQATAERKKLPPYQPAGRVLQRWMMRVMDRQRLVNLLASNLPGPPSSMFFAGSKVLEVFQAGVVQGNLNVAAGVLSYAGQLNFDIASDIDTLPDISVFAMGLTDELRRLGVTSDRHQRPSMQGLSVPQ